MKACQADSRLQRGPEARIQIELWLSVPPRADMGQSHGSTRQDAEVGMRHWPGRSRWWRLRIQRCGWGVRASDLSTSISGVKGPLLWVLGYRRGRKPGMLESHFVE